MIWLPRQRGRRVPVKLQMAETECGAACLAMVLSAYGRRTSVAECRKMLDIGRDGSSGLQLVQLARALGMRVRGLRLDLDDLSTLRLPAIVHWNFQHYLVLERWNERRAVVVDPGSGRRSMTHAEFARCFTGVAIELTPTERLERRNRSWPVASLRFARSILTISPWLVLQVLAVSLVLQLATLLPAVLTKFAVDVVIGGRQVEMLTILGIGMMLLVATQATASYARSSVLNYLHARLDASMMRRFFDHLLALPYRYFQLRSSGDLLLRLSSNVVIRDMLTSQTMSFVIDGLFVIGYVVLLLSLAPVYGWLVLALGATQLAVVVATFRIMRERTNRDIAAQAEAQGYTVEVLAGAETVKALGAEDQVLSKWSGLFDTQLLASLRRRQLETGLETFLAGFRLGVPMLLLWFGVREVAAGRMSLGTMLALNALAGALLAPIMALINAARQLQTVGTHLDRIRDVIDEPVEQAPSGSGPIPVQARITGRVTLTAVSMRYSTNAPCALQNIDLDIPAGSKIALVGRTGSGKSTLAKVILGLYPSTTGEVRFDDRLLQDLDYRRLRRQCGIVTQDPALFAGSVRENIALGHPFVPFDDILLAAQRAQIYDEILAMPMGFETRLTEGGGGLSGGQRQRLALARALLHNPSLLLLDEATSHLDVVTERRVEEVLSTLRCTRIVIAHRLSTVVDADRIIVLDDGQIVEAGTHEELLLVDGSYRALISDQLMVSQSQ